MGRKKKQTSVTNTYVKYLRDVLPLVATDTRYPKLVDYERHVASLVAHDRNKEMLQNNPDATPVTYTARDVHTQVWRAMQVLCQAGEVLYINGHYYPASEDGVLLFALLRDNIPLRSPAVHIISGTTYALAITPEYDLQKIEFTLQACLGKENLFGFFIQNNILVILLSPAAPPALLAELAAWVKDAYWYQSKKTQ